MLIRLAEYAKKLGKHPDYVRQRAAAGTATEKSGRHISSSKDTRTIKDYTIRLMRLRKRGEMRKKSISHHFWKNTKKGSGSS